MTKRASTKLARRRKESEIDDLHPVSVVFDGGNALIKIILGLIQSTWLDFTHALVELTEAEWLSITEGLGGQPHPDYLEINGRYYAVGDAAMRLSTNTRRVGADRYRPDYIGILLAAALYRIFEMPVGPITIMASHPPRDSRYAKDLRTALKGTWRVKSGDDARIFKVTRALTFLEPVGGMMCAALDDNGNEVEDVTSGDVCVVDIGGGTANISIATNGVVDPGQSYTMSQGIIGVTDRFESELRNQYSDLFKSTNIIPAKRLRAALRDGYYVGAGRELDCRNIAALASNPFLNILDGFIQSNVGGVIGFDRIMVTGGGGGLLINRLPEILNTDEIYLVYGGEDIHFANAIGGRKLWLAKEALSE